MKLTQHGPNLWQATHLFVINCYFVREDDGLTLVDTGMAGSGEALLRAAAQIGLSIRRVTLTHAHVDHAGSLDELRERLPEVEVALGPRSRDFLGGDLSLRPGEAPVALKGGFVERTTRPTRLLQPGEMLGSLRVVASPGHSPDHLAFFDERDGTLIAGDAFQTQGGIAVAGVRRWLFPLPAFGTWHPPTALDSARALCALGPTRLAVGHGRVLESPLPLMEGATREAEEAVGRKAATA